MSTPNLKSSIEATAPYLKFVTNIKKDASGKPTVQITAKAPIGFVRGAAPQHPWSAGGLNFWLREAYRMRHFVLGEYDVCA